MEHTHTNDGRRHAMKGFNARAFYEVLEQVVTTRKVTWRELARDTGITPSTLSRMARGKWPDAAGLAALSAWADLNPADFVFRPTASPSRDSLGAISRLLRSDPNLEPTAVTALEAIIGVAYARLSQEPF